MSIYPKGTNADSITWLYNLRSAVGDLPVPQILRDITEKDEKEKYEWINYVACLPVSMQLKKLGEGIDLLVNTAKKTPEDLQRINSIDIATRLIAVKMHERFYYPISDEEGGYCGHLKNVKTYYEPALFFIFDMMKGASSPDLPIWEKRLDSLKEINEVIKAADKAFGRPFGTPLLKSSPKDPSP